MVYTTCLWWNWGWFIIVLPTLYMMCTMFILQIACSKIANESSLPTGLQVLFIPKCPKYPSKSHLTVDEGLIIRIKCLEYVFFFWWPIDFLSWIQLHTSSRNVPCALCFVKTQNLALPGRPTRTEGSTCTFKDSEMLCSVCRISPMSQPLLWACTNSTSNCENFRKSSPGPKNVAQLL